PNPNRDPRCLPFTALPFRGFLLNWPFHPCQTKNPSFTCRHRSTTSPPPPRLLGEDVFFLPGTDEHGQKIERSAAAAGIPPQQFADQVAQSFADLWAPMGITHNKFIRTTHPD